MSLKFAGAATIGLFLMLPALAHGGELDDGARAPADPVRTAVADGSFLPLTMPARVGGTRAFASGSSGYDSARSGPMADVAVEVTLWGGIALRGGATYSQDQSRMRPSAGARVQFAHQDAHGIDGSLGVFYKAEGFTEAEGEIETFVSVGRRFGHWALVGNLVYGQDPEGNERDGELRTAAFRQMGRFAFGVDARVRSAIGTQLGKAATIEPKLDGMGGPLAIVTLGPIGVFAELGPSVVRMPEASARFGLAAFGGLVSAF
jgi:hypothetical protein